MSSRILKRILSSHDPEEQVPPSPNLQTLTFPPTAATTTTTSRPPLTVSHTDSSALVPPEDKLLTFRSLTGIDTVPALTSSGHSARTAPNIGIYTRVVQSERKAGLNHSRFGLLVNCCLALQVVVGAFITALGAAKGSHKVVTVFGALNTIVAGILTYLKGSGLPDKFKFCKEEWRQLREHVEQREREFCLVGCRLDVQEEMLLIEDMYRQVKAKLEGTHTPGVPNDAGRGHGRHDERRQSTVSTPTLGRFPMRRSETLFESEKEKKEHV